jgi:formylglycine-generating enzyme required for sulfatase activity/predicted Ser/Thr protein kinase
MKILELFSWVASGLLEVLFPGGILVESISEELKRYHESATKIAEAMQRAWAESLKTLELALGGGGWLAPKSRKQFGEKFAKEVITPFAVKNDLTGGKLDSFLKKALEQCRALLNLQEPLIHFGNFDEKTLLDALASRASLKDNNVSVEDMGGFIVDRVQSRLPHAKELLELLWYRNLLLEGMVAYFHMLISQNRALADVVDRMDRERIQQDLREIKDNLSQALKENKMADIGSLGMRANQLAVTSELYQLQHNYQDLFGQVLDGIEKLQNDHQQIKGKLEQIIDMLQSLQKMQQSRTRDSRIRPDLITRRPNMAEIHLLEHLNTLVKDVGWQSLPEPQREHTANAMAVSYYSSQKTCQALAVLEDAMKHQIKSPALYYNYFQVLQTIGRCQDAVAIYPEVVQLDSTLALFPPDKYEMLDILDRGGMGVVYKALWRERDMPVAIKVLMPDDSQTSARQRFCLTACTAQTLHHPNIVTIYEVACEEERPAYIVMEYLKGIDLQSKVKRDGPYNLAEGMEVARGIAAGLSFTHQSGIVHRDLKPGNIIVTRNVPKIIDFGLAKWEGGVTITWQGESYYTLYYSAPEQLADFHKADARSDIYSLGKTLYYLFTGDEPYDIEWDDVPSCIRPVLQRATRKNPDKRYTTVAQMLAELEKAVAGEPREADSMSETDSFPLVQLSHNLPQPVFQAGQTTATALQIVVNDSDQSEMVVVPEGAFLMGDASDYADYDERPVHEVYLDAYLIDVYPVTNDRYAKFLQALEQCARHPSPWCHPCEPAGKIHIPQFFYSARWNQPGYPVVGVDWWDAWAYSTWAGKSLPSEAQWEKAARGNDGRIYPWGHELPAPDRCNFNKVYGQTTPVDKFAGDRSPYGCACMAGNVWEWCLDWFDPTYYRRSPACNPTGPETGRLRAGRGGSWVNNARRVSTTTRAYGAPEERNSRVGFRSARLLEKNNCPSDTK